MNAHVYTVLKDLPHLLIQHRTQSLCSATLILIHSTTKMNKKPQSHHQKRTAEHSKNNITKAITLYKKMKWYCLSLNKTCCIIHFMYFHRFCVQKMPRAQLISLWCALTVSDYIQYDSTALFPYPKKHIKEK